MNKTIQLFLLLLLSVTCHAADIHRLSRLTQAVDISATVWDFSQSDDCDESPVYRLYGDSLVAEIYHGVRQWYSIGRDSTFYLGEESRSHKALLQVPVQTSAFGNMLLAGRDSCAATGLCYKTFSLGHEGCYESFFPVKGTIIIDSGRELSAEAVTERREFISWLAASAGSERFATTREEIRTRWFMAGSRLPIAFQITENTLDNGRTVTSETSTFIVASDDIEIDDDDLSHNLQQALDDARITVSDGMLRIEGVFPAGAELIMHMSSLSGGTFHQEPVRASFDGSLWAVPIPHVPPGQYILTVSAGTPVSRKIPVIL